MTNAPTTIGLTRAEMAQRVAIDIPDGSYVNLGIGIPELITQFVPEGRELIYHTWFKEGQCRPKDMIPLTKEVLNKHGKCSIQ